MAKSINIDMIKGVDAAVKYPSEHFSPANIAPSADDFSIFKTVPGAVLKGRRLKVKASTTLLWSKNPRNYAPNKDISDLRPLIKESGGNTQAVDGRLVNGKVEIIAGSRRRLVCIEEGLELTVDLYEDVSDEQAHYIAFTENQRKDVDVLSQACYLLARFEELKNQDSTLTVEIFANMHSMKLRNMQYYLSVAKLPLSIHAAANQREQWSLRQGIKLKDYYDKLVASGLSEEQVIYKASLPLSTPALVLNALKKLIKPELTHTGSLETPKYKLTTDKSGACKFQTVALTNAQIKKLKAFLDQL